MTVVLDSRAALAPTPAIIILVLARFWAAPGRLRLWSPVGVGLTSSGATTLAWFPSTRRRPRRWCQLRVAVEGGMLAEGGEASGGGSAGGEG